MAEPGTESACSAAPPTGSRRPAKRSLVRIPRFRTRTLTTLDLDMPRFDACSETFLQLVAACCDAHRLMEPQRSREVTQPDWLGRPKYAMAMLCAGSTISEAPAPAAASHGTYARLAHWCPGSSSCESMASRSVGADSSFTQQRTVAQNHLFLKSRLRPRQQTRNWRMGVRDRRVVVDASRSVGDHSSGYTVWIPVRTQQG